MENISKKSSDSSHNKTEKVGNFFMKHVQEENKKLSDQLKAYTLSIQRKNDELKKKDIEIEKLKCEVEVLKKNTSRDLTDVQRDAKILRYKQKSKQFRIERNKAENTCCNLRGIVSELQHGAFNKKFLEDAAMVLGREGVIAPDDDPFKFGLIVGGTMTPSKFCKEYKLKPKNEVKQEVTRWVNQWKDDHYEQDESYLMEALYYKISEDEIEYKKNRAKQILNEIFHKGCMLEKNDDRIDADKHFDDDNYDGVCPDDTEDSEAEESNKENKN